MRIYAYVTAECCVTQRAVKPGAEIGGDKTPVSKCNDYEPWTDGKRQTLSLIDQRSSNVSMRRWQCARMVARLLDWIEDDSN
jgi:hypothetical protein